MGNDPVLSYTILRCTGSSTCTNFVSFATVSSTASSNTETYTAETTPRGVITRYQVCASNLVGCGTPSDAVTITTINVPTSMTTVTCSNITPYTITLNWPALDPSYNGGDPVTFYGVEYSVSSSTYTQLNTDFSNLYLTYTHDNGATKFL
jgi:hypothetical protein